VKIDNGTGGSRETSTGKPERVDERGRESINFFAELKRRNVYKVAVAYAVVAWLLIQAASIFFPAFDAPPWVMKIFIIVIIFGFPVALIFSWAFEITSEGIKLESEIEPNKSITRRTGRKIVAVTIALAVVAAGLFVYQLVRSKSPVTPRPASDQLRRDGQSEAATVAPDKSIAVLPFDNLSRDPDNAYFCEGVQDEILTRLAKVADLKVISRTSTQHFKSTPDNLPQIAKQLGVAHILEGSVQKAGDQVRVNVQLINALTDAHLWADTYDRKLTDIFAVESEIAKTIAETLQARLTGSEKSSIAKTPTVNPEAYELYLRGKFFAAKRTGADLRKSVGYYDQAIAKDPNYALAYVGLADSHLLLSAYGAISPKESIPPARDALKKALDLDDSLAQAHASSGLLATLELDLDRAIRELERAIQLDPNYATAHHWLALPLMAIGQFDRAIVEAKRAIELDPLSLICNSDLGWIYFNARRYDEAEAQARKTLEMDSRFVVAHYYLGEVFQFKGRLNDAIAEYQKAFDLNNDPFSFAMLGQAYARQGKTDEARKVLARLSEEAKSQYVAPYALAVVLTALGDKARAIDELERGYDEGGFYISLIKVDPLFDPLHGDPRFETLVQKVLSKKQ
jgi:TolB-like protein/tetratricopeptide (TPR) repeat protein